MNVLSRLDALEMQNKALQNGEPKLQPSSALTQKQAPIGQRRSTLAEAKQRSPVITSPRYNKRVLSPIPPEQKEGSALRSVKKKNTLPIKTKDVVISKTKRNKKSPSKELKVSKLDPKENPIQPWTSENLKELKEKELEQQTLGVQTKGKANSSLGDHEIDEKPTVLPQIVNIEQDEENKGRVSNPSSVSVHAEAKSVQLNHE